MVCLYTRGRIIRLDELGQAFVVRLAIRLDELSSVVRRSSAFPFVRL